MSHGPSDYELHQIESVLQGGAGQIQTGVGLYLAPMLERFEIVHTAAVAPAMRANGLNPTDIFRVFHSDSLLSEVASWIRSAEVIVADLSGCNADLMYVAGLCHDLRRCPLLIAARGTDLPFNLGALRCIEYGCDFESIWELRERLTRAIRIFLTATNTGSPL